MIVGSVRGLCVVGMIMCAIGILVTCWPKSSGSNQPSTLALLGQIEEVTERESLRTALQRSLIHKGKLMGAYQRSLFISNLLNGVAIIFFLLIFIKAREVKVQSD